MAQPVAYTPSADFTGTQAGSATAALGVALDVEFDNLERTTDDIRENLAQIQRDDGALANNSVGVDQLDDTALALMSNFSLRGEWQAGVSYLVGDMFADGGSLYLTAVDHTADVLADDITAGYVVGPLLGGGTASSAASAADIWEGTSNSKVITPAGIIAASAPVALTSGTTVTPNFNSGSNFTLTLAHNAVLANPSNMSVGDSGAILITQDGAGGRTMSYGNKWKFPGGPQLLSTAPGAIDLITYWVAGSNLIVCNICKDFSSV